MGRRRTWRSGRGSAVAVASAEADAEARPPLRFEVGARVECNVGRWALGVVVRHWYREPGWTDEEVVPYQIKLDNGPTIYAPLDNDECIRATSGILSFGKVPVTVLTGFLGAGKTTLLNYILRAQHGKRYAVIENEFGDVAIDDMLLDQSVGKQSTMESITVLDNGCLCCTMRDDLVAAIKGVLDTVERRLASGEPNAMIDGILIETTGMADPGPICKTFDLDDDLSAYCKIDGILTVVDAVHFLRQLRRERPADSVNEPAQQVAFADKVLLNKVDAVGREQVAEIIAEIRSVNSLVSIKECSLAKRPDDVPIGELIAIDAFDATRLLTPEGEVAGLNLSSASEPEPEHGDGHSSCGECSNPECTDPSHEHSHDHAHAHVQSRHDTDIGTMVLEQGELPLDVERFQVFLQGLLSERSVDLYRYKGVLAVDQGGVLVRYVLQGVHDMVEISFSGEWPAQLPAKTQIVLIGRKLDEKVIRERFAECVCLPLPVAP